MSLDLAALILAARAGRTSARQEHRLDNLEAAAKGVLYEEQTDSDAAHSKTVPAGALPWADLGSIGGRSILLNQLAKNGNFADGTDSWSGLRCTVSAEDGTLTAVIGEDTPRYVSCAFLLTTGHAYLCAARLRIESAKSATQWRYQTSNSNNSEYSDYFDVTDEWTDVAKILKLVDPEVTHSPFSLRSTSTAAYMPEAGDELQVQSVRVFDLTLMFGAAVADTITTPEEAYALGCPRGYVEYDTEGTPVHAAVTSVVSRDAEDAALGTLAIPAAVRALEGYGQSPVGGAGNVLDLAAMRYTEAGRYVNGAWSALETPAVADVSAYFEDNSIAVEAGGSLTFAQNGTEIPVPNSVTYSIALG